jgi:hypothetical protein
MGSTVVAEVRRRVAEAGADGALTEALAAAGLDEVPEDPHALAVFLDHHLMDALVGHLHPATAGQLVVAIRDEVLVEQKSGSRPRPSPRDSEEMATVPPPASGEAQQAYEDLATGAVHTRATPAWGLRAVPEDGEAPGEALWIVSSDEPGLLETARRAAPSGTDVIVASSMAVLKSALARAAHPASAVVLDAAQPSVPLDRAVAALTEEPGGPRVVLWRMSTAERQRLADALPHTRAWLPCDAEVTPAEIVQLLGARR